MYSTAHGDLDEYRDRRSLATGDRPVYGLASGGILLCIPGPRHGARCEDLGESCYWVMRVMCAPLRMLMMFSSSFPQGAPDMLWRCVDRLRSNLLVNRNGFVESILVKQVASTEATSVDDITVAARWGGYM